MKRRKLATVKQFSRWVRSRFTQGALILLYHRVSHETQEAEPDPFLLGVTDQRFEEHLRVLRKMAYPMSLGDLAQALKRGTLPPRAVAVTFDDGYADNFYLAKPMLEKFNIPATVFVLAGCLGDTFWWDDLTRIILQPEILPQNLGLKLSDFTYQTSLKSNSKMGRRRLLQDLHRSLRSLSSAQQQIALQHLSNWAGFVLQSQCNRRALSLEELKRLADGELVEIGAHTVTHPSLANLPPSKQRREITNSKVFLENVLNKPIKGFSYPFGLKNDFTNETITIVQEAGFDYACSSEIDTVWSKSDPYQLPRYWVKNWSGPVFAKHLQWWLPG